MKFVQSLILALIVSGTAFAGDTPRVPEAGIDGPTIASAIGLVAGGLIILRARRK